jgi:hypothetical protein
MGSRAPALVNGYGSEALSPRRHGEPRRLHGSRDSGFESVPAGSGISKSFLGQQHTDRVRDTGHKHAQTSNSVGVLLPKIALAISDTAVMNGDLESRNPCNLRILRVSVVKAHPNLGWAGWWRPRARLLSLPCRQRSRWRVSGSRSSRPITPTTSRTRSRARTRSTTASSTPHTLHPQGAPQGTLRAQLTGSAAAPRRGNRPSRRGRNGRRHSGPGRQRQAPAGPT